MCICKCHEDCQTVKYHLKVSLGGGLCSVDMQSEYLNLTCNRDGDCSAVAEETKAYTLQLHVNIDRNCMYLMNI